MNDGSFQREFEFTLPRGYRDDGGDLHREGTMRLATAADEIKPLNDPRVQSNPSYLPVLVLSRTITRLGSLDGLTPDVIENLYVPDLEYLQDLYERINERGADAIDVVCPACSEEFTVETGSGSPIDDTELINPTETAGVSLRPAVRSGIIRRHWGSDKETD
jgi:hypothetical protein